MGSLVSKLTGASKPERSMGPYVLLVEGVTVQIGGILALFEVSLAARPGEVLGIIGPNGAGKTTLFDVISGLRAPTAGSVWLEGIDITSMSPVWRSRHGMRRTFQRQQVVGALTVEENLLVAQEWRGGGGGLLADLVGLPGRVHRERQRRERAGEVLSLCGLTEVRSVEAGTLPIGMARMVELGRAVVDGVRVLLLDEPTSGLGHTEMEQLAQTIHRLKATQCCAVLLIEHDVRFVMQASDRIVALNLGRVLAAGSPGEVRADAAVRAAYLG
jgi:branched-chain amino acid transport system ATP-binding protein